MIRVHKLTKIIDNSLEYNVEIRGYKLTKMCDVIYE